MPRGLDVGDLPRIAQFLLEPADLVPSAERVWDAAEVARIRSSINRSYYGVFIYLKNRISSHSVWEFPRRGAHRKVRLALEEVLGYRDPVVQKFRDLQLDRGKADYDIGHHFAENDAEDLVDVANDILVELQDLDKDQWGALAGEVQRLTTEDD